MAVQSAPHPDVSVVVPTYNEADTIESLLDQLSGAIPSSLSSELVVVDDESPDGTGRIVDGYAARHAMAGEPLVRLIERRGERGLGSAIVRGIKESSGHYVVVMDADLSHPPSVVPLLLQPLCAGQCDVAIASRRVRGGQTVGWPFTRKLTSWGATLLARGLGVRVKDPMSGFFAFDSKVTAGMQFYAIGYKILPEILVKSAGLRVTEIPYTFVNRKAGSSKLGLRVVLEYLRMTWKLYGSTRARHE